MARNLKSVSKLSRHFLIFVNIFHNFNAISDFSFALNSYGYENIFQPKKISNPLILLSKNEDEKFSVNRTAYFCLMKNTWLDSPGFSQFKNVYGVALRHLKRL